MLFATSAPFSVSLFETSRARYLGGYRTLLFTAFLRFLRLRTLKVYNSIRASFVAGCVDFSPKFLPSFILYPMEMPYLGLLLIPILVWRGAVIPRMLVTPFVDSHSSLFFRCLYGRCCVPPLFFIQVRGTAIVEEFIVQATRVYGSGGVSLNSFSLLITDGQTGQAFRRPSSAIQPGFTEGRRASFNHVGMGAFSPPSPRSSEFGKAPLLFRCGLLWQDRLFGADYLLRDPNPFEFTIENF